jgi:hypothetical protein
LGMRQGQASGTPGLLPTVILSSPPVPWAGCRADIATRDSRMAELSNTFYKQAVASGSAVNPVRAADLVRRPGRA